MRIGVVCAEEIPRRGFKITKTAQFGAVEIYKASACKNAGKRRFAREMRRCVKALLNIGVSVCAAEEDLSNIYPGKMTYICSGERVIRARAGDAALFFAAENGICADILIRGGSFSEVLETSKQILRVRRNIYVQNHAFEDIAEAIYAETGVSIGACESGSFLEINLGGEGHFLKFKDKNADFSDISVKLPEIFSGGIPPKLIPPLAETLEISGFLRKKEIKVGYLPK